MVIPPVTPTSGFPTAIYGWAVSAGAPEYTRTGSRQQLPGTRLVSLVAGRCW